MHIVYYDLYDHALAQELYPRDLEMYNFSFLCHYYCILNLSDLCSSVDKTWRIDTVCSIYGHAQALELLSSGSYNYKPCKLLVLSKLQLLDSLPSFPSPSPLSWQITGKKKKECYLEVYDWTCFYEKWQTKCQRLVRRVHNCISTTPS